MKERKNDSLLNDLVNFIAEKSDAGISLKKVADATSLIVNIQGNTGGLISLIDKYYLQIGFKLSDESSSDSTKLTLRTYRHLSGSNAQVMVAKNSKYSYRVFINNNEDERQRELRLKCSFYDKLEKQNLTDN